MNSIDQQQQEKNQKDLFSTEAREKIKELAGKAKSCFFCTNIETNKPFDTRPMAIQKVDDQGAVWFLSSDDSFKNEDIKRNPYVQLLFQGSQHSDFLSLYGKATISKDKSKIKELWTPIAKTWFTEGVDDTRITVINVTPESGHYWDTKHGSIVSFAKILAGAIIGKTMDDGIQGQLHV